MQELTKYIIFQNVLYIKNVKRYALILQWYWFWWILTLKWNIHHLQNTEIIIFMLQSGRNVMDVNIHLNLHCIQYKEIRLDGFCIQCQNLCMTLFKDLCTACSLKTVHLDHGSTLKGCAGLLSSYGRMSLPQFRDLVTYPGGNPILLLLAGFNM